MVKKTMDLDYAECIDWKTHSICYDSNDDYDDVELKEYYEDVEVEEDPNPYYYYYYDDDNQDEND